MDFHSWFPLDNAVKLNVFCNDLQKMFNKVFSVLCNYLNKGYDAKMHQKVQGLRIMLNKIWKFKTCNKIVNKIIGSLSFQDM